MNGSASGQKQRGCRTDSIPHGDGSSRKARTGRAGGPSRALEVRPGGGEGDGGGTWGDTRPRRGGRSSLPAPPSPQGSAPPQPAGAGLPSRLAPHPRAPGGRPPHGQGTPGWAGGSSASAAGSPRLLPFLEGRGRRGRGGRRPARPQHPAPPAAPGPARPRAARPPGRAPGLSLPAGPRGGGGRPGAAGRAGGGGWRGGASGAADPSPVPLPSAPSSPSLRGSLVSCRRPLPWRRRSRASALPARGGAFPPRSPSLSPLFFFFSSSFFLSACGSADGGARLSECWPLVGKAPLRETEGDGEGREVTWRKGNIGDFPGASGNRG